MVIRLACGALHGVDAFRVDLEVDYIRKGLPGFTMVGLAEGAVKEAKERVFSALRSCGFKIPPARIVVNLAPADRRKAGSAYDLPLAMALLAATGYIQPEQLEPWFIAGELSLTGAIKPVTGILPMAILAQKEGAKGVLTSPENALEGAIVADFASYGLPTLSHAVDFINGKIHLEPTSAPELKDEPQDFLLDFAEVKGQEHAKRAIEIAAAGGHNLLFMGPPGSGKTMLAKRVPTVLPPLTFEESLEITKIYSVANCLGDKGLVRHRPFRSPHHTISDVALVGGGVYPRPGEVSLAHRGVLFLDELPEFGKATLEVLRGPLEDGVVTVSRAAQSATFPANCMLVAAMNPCPCGYASEPDHTCVCTAIQEQRYRSRLSGPLLDRIDLHISVPAVPFDDLRSKKGGSSSAEIRQRVVEARQRQYERYKDWEHIHSNADLSGKSLQEFCVLHSEEEVFLRHAVESLRLSARSYTRILRVARTIADLANEENISGPHLAEAISCRMLDRE